MLQPSVMQILSVFNIDSTLYCDIITPLNASLLQLKIENAMYISVANCITISLAFR